MTVGTNGLVLDTNGKTMGIAANIGGIGAITKTGAGTLTISQSQTVTSGALSVAAGALALAGGVSVARPVALADGATLKFNFTERKNPPVLNLDGKGVTLGDEKNVTVVLSGERPRGKASAYVLTEGGKFSETNVALASRPAWVEDFGVDADGNIFVKALANGLMLFVR